MMPKCLYVKLQALFVNVIQIKLFVYRILHKNVIKIQTDTNLG